MVTEEMVAKALSIATRRHEVGASDGGTYAVSVPTLETMRAALEAVAPMVHNATLEEAAKKAEHFRTSEDGERYAFAIAAAIRALAMPAIGEKP